MSTTTVPCPYCLGDIAPQAQACKHCTRDLGLFKPILQQVHALEQRLGKVQEEMARLAATLEQIHHTPLSRTLAQAASEIDAPLPEADVPQAASSELRFWLAPFITVAALSLVHWVLLFVYDMPLVFFRVLTFFIPALLGFWAARGSLGRAWIFGLMGAVIGAASVTSMLWVSHYIDAVPWAPQNLREWRETLEYALSISLAFLTGHLVSASFVRWQASRVNVAGIKAGVVLLLQKDELGKLKLEQLSSGLLQVATTLAPLFSGAVALYSALKNVVGS